MKTLIFKDSSEESHLNQQINVGLTIVNDVLVQYQRTTLKPITDKATLQQFFADPVKFVSDQVQLSANLSGWKINPAKMVDLLQEPEITELLKMAKAAGGQALHYAMDYGKLTKKGLLEVDQNAWALYIDQQVCKYATTPAQIKAFNTLSKLIQAVTELHEEGGIPYETIIRRPLTDIYLKYNGEQHPPLINLHGFGKLAG